MDTGYNILRSIDQGILSMFRTPTSVRTERIVYLATAIKIVEERMPLWFLNKKKPATIDRESF